MTVQNRTVQTAETIAASPTASNEARQRASRTLAMAQLVGDGSDLTGAHFVKLNRQERQYLLSEYPDQYERLSREGDRAAALALIEDRRLGDL